MIKFNKLPEDIHDRISELTKYMECNPDIIFAYLFGGLARNKVSPLSDVDIAVYLSEHISRPDYLALFHEITEALGTEEVDLVILNTAPISIAGRVLMSRKVLVDKQPFTRHRFESIHLRMYFDFMEREKYIVNRRYGIG